METSVIHTDISGNVIIFILSEIYSPKKVCLHVKSKKRSFNNKSMLDFKNKLHQENWDLILNMNDTNDVYDAFLDKFSLLYNESCSLKAIKIKTKTISNS